MGESEEGAGSQGAEYSAMASPGAMWVAKGAELGQFSEFVARQAARRGDLFHPQTWPSWIAAEDEAFERAAGLLSPAEMERLRCAHGERGENWAFAFAPSPRKLRALIGAGLDPSEKTCSMGNRVARQVEAAMWACHSGWRRVLAGMIEAGLTPPGPCSGGLRAFANSPRPKELPSEEAEETIARWILSGGCDLDGSDEAGNDSLKLAIRRGNAPLARALLSLGADPAWENGAGQNALAVMEALPADWSAAPEMKELAAVLRAKLEAKAIGRAIGSVSPLSESKRPAL